MKYRDFFIRPDTLTHHGARSFIDFLGSIRLDYRPQYDVAKRLFIDAPHNLIRLYITNLHKRYSQEIQLHFPNLFLNDGVVAPAPSFSDAHKAHRHTYWLKYLILKYIWSELTSGRKVVTEKELLELFVESGAYEPWIFKLVLGSLNNVTTSRCIELEEPALGPSLRIRLTKRGEALVSSNPAEAGRDEFFFNFDYLQFVIDDCHLSLPRLWFKEVFVDADIGYAFAPSATYAAELRHYLAKKTVAVIVFLRILEASASAEKRYRLRDTPQLLNLFPNFPDLYASTIKSFDRILEKVSH